MGGTEKDNNRRKSKNAPRMGQKNENGENRNPETELHQTIT